MNIKCESPPLPPSPSYSPTPVIPKVHNHPQPLLTPFRTRPSSSSPLPRGNQGVSAIANPVSLNNNQTTKKCCATNSCPQCCCVSRHNAIHKQQVLVLNRQVVQNLGLSLANSAASTNINTSVSATSSSSVGDEHRLVRLGRRKESQIGAALNGTLMQRARCIKTFLRSNKGFPSQ